MKKSSLILIAASGFSLVACNSGDGSSGSSTTPTSGLTTSFASGNSFNATMDDPTANKILTLANTGESNISDITFTLPTNNYFTLTNDDTGVKPCTIGTDNTLTNALESNQSCTVKVTYSNATTTSSASTNIVFDYLYGQSNKTLNTPITYQTTSSTSPTSNWTTIGATVPSVPDDGLLLYDNPTKSIYYKYSNNICTISENASSTTAWECFNPFPNNVNVNNNITGDSNGHIYAIAFSSSNFMTYIYTISTQTKAITNTASIYYFDTGDNQVNAVGSGTINYYANKLYWFEKPKGSLTESSFSVNTSGGAITIGASPVPSNSSGSASQNAINQLNGTLYRYDNSGTFRTSSLLGSNVNNWISATNTFGFTIAGNNLYRCVANVSGTNAPVQKISLDATSTTLWTGLPQISVYADSVYGGCNFITNGNGYLFAYAQVFDDSGFNRTYRLVKYKY